MEKYSEYKDSGIQWLGCVPKQWDILQIRFILKENVRKPLDSDIPLSLSQIDGLIPTDEMKENSLKTGTYEGWKRVLKDDIVLNRFKAHLGVLFASNYIGMVSFHYGVYEKQRELIPKYYEYLFHSDQYRLILGFASKGMTIGLQNLGNSDFYNLRVLYPSISEQKSIVAYLDTQTSRIDSFIANVEREIELLGEAKQRIIADAVTKGLNKDVEMKESGVEWLGEIPAHWSFTKIRSIAKEKKVKNVGNIENNVLSLSYGNIIRKINKDEGLAPKDFATYQIVEKNDIILRLTDLQNDHRSLRTGFVEERGIITSAYLCICTKQVSKYIQLLLHSYDIRKVFYGMGGGIRQSMNYKDIGNLYIPVPPINEQLEIVDFISQKTSQIDTLISSLSQQIASLKEYKQRLISDVVTGQINVQQIVNDNCC